MDNFRQEKKAGALTPGRIVLSYILLGGFWIYFSDTVLSLLIRDPELITRISVAKGLLFVAVTASVLYWLIRKSHDELRKSHALLRLVAEETTDAIYVKDRNGRYLLFNSAAERAAGKKAGDVIGKDDTFLFSPEEARTVMEGDRAVMDSGKQQTYEEDLTTGSGEKATYLSTKGPLLDEDGRVVGLFGIARDITSRKRTEKALQASESRYKAIVENQAEFVVRYLTGGIVTFINDTFCRYLGMKREDLLGRSYYPFMFEDDRTSFIRQIESLGRDNASMVAEARVRLPDGRVAWHKWTHAAIFDREGGIAEYQATGRDITENRRTEEMVALLKYSIDISSDAAFWYDSSGRFVYVNDAACRSVGYERDELLKLHINDIKPGAGEADFSALWKQLRDLKTIRMESVHRRRDGVLFPVEIISTYVDFGDREYVCGFARDITRRKRAEEQSARVQKLEAIGTLAGGIAHDFNNLLQGVFGYISLAKLLGDRKDKSIAALDEAEKALHMTVRLTNQLLTFAKGGKPLKERIDLRPVLENATKFALSGSRSDCVITADNDLWQTEADEGQIGQVIQNMVLNADQAMPTGGTVEIAARNVVIAGRDLPQDLKEGRYVEIAIRDSGIGISKQYMGQIFDPYFTTKEKGSGLGLATSYSIIKNHGGSVDVKSETGKGSEFLVYLPAAGACGGPLPLQPQTAASEHRTGKVLFMDDDKVVREVAGTMLKALGHEVEFAAKGEEAVARYRAAMESGKPFDAVILDLTIRGGMGGAETARELRRIDPGVKAVMSSGYSDDPVAAGLFLKKPYTAADLRDALNRLLAS